MQNADMYFEKVTMKGRIDTTYNEFVTADFWDQIGDLIELCFENGFPTCTIKSIIVRITRFWLKKKKKKGWGEIRIRN